MKKILFVIVMGFVSGCVSARQLEEILAKIDHNNRVILKRLETLENEKREESKEEVPDSSKQ